MTMTRFRPAIAYLGCLAAPAGVFAALALALELLLPGSVSRWVDVRAAVILPAAFWLAYVLVAARPEPARLAPYARIVSALVLVAVAAGAVWASAGPGWRFLLSALLATVLIAYPVLRDVQE